jgi:hypothetical protein
MNSRELSDIRAALGRPIEGAMKAERKQMFDEWRVKRERREREFEQFIDYKYRTTADDLDSRRSQSALGSAFPHVRSRNMTSSVHAEDEAYVPTGLPPTNALYGQIPRRPKKMTVLLHAPKSDPYANDNEDPATAISTFPINTQNLFLNVSALLDSLWRDVNEDMTHRIVFRRRHFETHSEESYAAICDEISSMLQKRNVIFLLERRIAEREGYLDSAIVLAKTLEVRIAQEGQELWDAAFYRTSVATTLLGLRTATVLVCEALFRWYEINPKSDYKWSAGQGIEYRKKMMNDVDPLYHSALQLFTDVRLTSYNPCLFPTAMYFRYSQAAEMEKAGTMRSGVSFLTSVVGTPATQLQFANDSEEGHGVHKDAHFGGLDAIDAFSEDGTNDAGSTVGDGDDEIGNSDSPERRIAHSGTLAKLSRSAAAAERPSPLQVRTTVNSFGALKPWNNFATSASDAVSPPSRYRTSPSARIESAASSRADSGQPFLDAVNNSFVDENIFLQAPSMLQISAGGPASGRRMFSDFSNAADGPSGFLSPVVAPLGRRNSPSFLLHDIMASSSSASPKLTIPSPSAFQPSPTGSAISQGSGVPKKRGSFTSFRDSTLSFSNPNGLGTVRSFKRKSGDSMTNDVSSARLSATETVSNVDVDERIRVLENSLNNVAVRFNRPPPLAKEKVRHFMRRWANDLLDQSMVRKALEEESMQRQGRVSAAALRKAGLSASSASDDQSRMKALMDAIASLEFTNRVLSKFGKRFQGSRSVSPSRNNTSPEQHRPRSSWGTKITVSPDTRQRSLLEDFARSPLDSSPSEKQHLGVGIRHNSTNSILSDDSHLTSGSGRAEGPNSGTKTPPRDNQRSQTERLRKLEELLQGLNRMRIAEALILSDLT